MRNTKFSKTKYFFKKSSTALHNKKKICLMSGLIKNGWILRYFPALIFL